MHGKTKDDLEVNMYIYFTVQKFGVSQLRPSCVELKLIYLWLSGVSSGTQAYSDFPKICMLDGLGMGVCMNGYKCAL